MQRSRFLTESLTFIISSQIREYSVAFKLHIYRTLFSIHIPVDNATNFAQAPLLCTRLKTTIFPAYQLPAEQILYIEAGCIYCSHPL